MENSVHTGAALATASREPKDMKMSCLISSGSIPHNEGLVVVVSGDNCCCSSSGEASCIESKASVAATTEALQAW